MVYNHYVGLVLHLFIDDISNPAVCNALIADFVLHQGLFTNTSTVFKPCSIAAFAAVSATSPAANGVLFLEPLKPNSPALAQDNTFPLTSDIVTIVLLKLE